MSDEDVRRYARELDRRGLDARRVAAEMLGCTDPERFWLLARRVDSDEPPHRTSDAVRSVLSDARCTQWTRATGVYGSPPSGRWEALHALAVVTVEEAVTLARAVAATGHAATLWDRKNGVRANGDGAPYLRVEEGWREPRDGPVAIPDVRPVWRRWDENAGRTHVRYGDVAFDVPDEPMQITGETHTDRFNGRTRERGEIRVQIFVPRGILTRPAPDRTPVADRLLEPGRPLEIDVGGVPRIRTYGAHCLAPWLSTRTNGDAVWGVTIPWSSDEPGSDPRARGDTVLFRGPNRLGSRCSFCDGEIRADGFSCDCPPCVVCRGVSHPAARCPARRFVVGTPVRLRTSPELGEAHVTEREEDDFDTAPGHVLVMWPTGGGGFYDPAVLEIVQAP